MQQAMDFLRDLAEHNDRDWYAQNKARHAAANAAFEAMLARLIETIGRFDPAVPGLEPRRLTFKMMRDTRYSHDKSPYNPALRAHIGPAGKLPVPVGYYVVVKPGGSFLGGGLFAPMFKDATERIRDAIERDPQGFLALVEAPAFAARFPVRGETLKNVPRSRDAESPAAAYLKHKSWYLELPLADSVAEDADALVRTAAETFAAMKPFNDWLNKALEGFVLPAR